ncbi:MAG: ABC transporter permease [Candidatus Aminicenantia bacterium]
MIFRLAWRNIWRNKRRTWILISAISIGYFSLFIYMTVTEGAIRQVVENIIDSGTGHIQIHKAGYLSDPEVKKSIKNPDEILKILNFNEIDMVTKRVNLQGVIYSPEETSPVRAIGGIPEKEKKLTKFTEYIVKGKFPEKEKEILIGSELEEILKVDLDDKVVLSCADKDGEISSFAFRVSGIFKSPSMEVNKFMVLTHITAAEKIAGYKNEANEIVIRLKNDKSLKEVLERTKKLIGSEYEVLSWEEIYPLIKYEFEIFREMVLLFGLIIFLGAVFGIMNVFYMSLFERMKEFGVLRAIGMKPLKLAKLIFAEGFLIGLISIGIGFFLGLILNTYLSVKGLNLSAFSKSLEIWGSGSIIYPYANFQTIIELTLLIMGLVIFSVIFPARKAVKIIITEALRYV